MKQKKNNKQTNKKQFFFAVASSCQCNAQLPLAHCRLWLAARNSFRHKWRPLLEENTESLFLCCRRSSGRTERDAGHRTGFSPQRSVPACSTPLLLCAWIQYHNYRCIRRPFLPKITSKVGVYLWELTHRVRQLSPTHLFALPRRVVFTPSRLHHDAVVCLGNVVMQGLTTGRSLRQQCKQRRIWCKQTHIRGQLFIRLFAKLCPNFVCEKEGCVLYAGNYGICFAQDEETC